MIKDNLHIVLKFPNISVERDENNSDTITEHKDIVESKGRMIWGQHSKRTNSGVAKKNREKLNDQIINNLNTYTFFVANNNGEKELYVGKLQRIYDRGEISADSPLKNYIPSYYASYVGTDNDQIIVFVDVITFYKIDSKYIDEIMLSSNNKKLSEIKNSSSIFLVNISDSLKSFLDDLNNNEDLSYQHQIDITEMPDDQEIKDVPKPKKEGSTTTSKTHKRDVNTAKRALHKANYTCEIDKSHQTFKSRKSRENYVEAHHLIPLQFQDEFPYSLDVEANIVSLCPLCHRKIHFGSDDNIKTMMEHFYNERITRLENCNINLSFVTLLDYYV